MSSWVIDIVDNAFHLSLTRPVRHICYNWSTYVKGRDIRAKRGRGLQQFKLLRLTAIGATIPHVLSGASGVSHPIQPKVRQARTNHHNQANSRKYFMLVFKRAGVQVEDLVKCYSTFVRSILEYVAPVWNLGLACRQINRLERIQRQTLRMILPDLNYEEGLETVGLPTLQQRREQISLNFGLGLLNSDEVSSCLPRIRDTCHQRSLRSNDKTILTDRRDKTTWFQSSVLPDQTTEQLYMNQKPIVL